MPPPAKPRRGGPSKKDPQTQAAVKVQVWWRRVKASQAFKAVAKTLARRTKIANELLETEQTYVQSLKAMIEVYVKPLRFNAQTSPNPIATAESVSVIFSNVELICKTNETLAESLAERMAGWDPMTTQLGDALKRLAPFLKLYTQYCQNYDKSLQVVAQCSQSQQFSAFLESGHLHPDSLNLHLADALIMPIQRIPRYIMLLTDLIKYTPDDHPDATDLAEALSLISDIARTVNQSMTHADSMNRIVEIQQMLTKDCPILVEPARRFIREGFLTKNREKRMYFLFNDILVYAAKQSSSMYQFKGLIPLNTTWIKDLDPAESSGLDHAFQIVSTKKTYTVTADSPAAKQEWIDDINAQIDELVTKDPSLVSRRAEAGQVVKSRFRRKGGDTAAAASSRDGSGIPVLLAPSGLDLPISTPKLSYRYLFSGNCEKVGSLSKLGSSRFTRWNSRIFLLKDMFLYYYKTEADEEPTGVIPLDGCIVESRQDISKKNKFYFDISHARRPRVYHIFAKDATTRTEWSNLLLRTINGDMEVSQFGLPFIFCNIANGPLIAKKLALESLIKVLSLPESQMLDEHVSALKAKDGASLLPPLLMTLNCDGPVFELGLAALRLFSRFTYTHKYLVDPANCIVEFLGGVMSRDGVSKNVVAEAAWTFVQIAVPQVGLTSEDPGPDRSLPPGSPLVPLVLLLEHATDDFFVDATIASLEYLARDAFMRSPFLEFNVIKPLVACLRTAKSHTAQYHGCLALFRVASNDSIRAAIPNLGAIPTLVTMLSSDSPHVIEASISALSVLASSPHNRVLMTESLFLTPLLAALESARTPNMRAVALDCIRAFSASVYGREVILDGGCFPALVSALDSNDVAVLTPVVAAVANVTESGASLIQSEFRELGGMSALFKVAEAWLVAEANKSNARLQESILRVLSNVCSLSEVNIALIVAETNVIALVVGSLSATVERVMAQAARLVAEISVSDPGARALQHASAVVPLHKIAQFKVDGATTHLASARISSILALANLAKSSIVVAHLTELCEAEPLDLRDLAFGAGASGVAARKLGAKLDLDFGVAPEITTDVSVPASEETIVQSGNRLKFAAPSKPPDASKAGTVIDSAVALESWMATTSAELDVATGDLVAVYDASNPDWWYGRIGSHAGYVPVFVLQTARDGLRKTTSATLDKAALVARLSAEDADQVDMTMEEEGVRMGYLKVQSTSVLKSWVKHFAVLEGGKFAVYKSVHDPEPVFELDVQVSNVKVASDLTFEMITPSKRYMLQGESVTNTNEWVSAIQDATAAQLRNVTSGKTGTLKRSHTKSKAQINKLIHDIWALPGNEVCADCFNVQPDWCSINLGILICIECSGFHRSLGTSVSKVRSLKLDDLVPYVEEFMKSVGNESINAIYEAWPSRVIRYKPSDPSLAGMRSQFIKYKYVERRLLGKDIEKDPAVLGAQLRAAVVDGSHMGILFALATGADIEWKPEPGAEPVLILALNHDAPRVVITALVLNNASLTETDADGNAPAHVAVTKARHDVLEILLDNNVDTTIVNADGLTADALADSLGDPTAAAILRDEDPIAAAASPSSTDDQIILPIMAVGPPSGTAEDYEDLLALIDDPTLPSPSEDNAAPADSGSSVAAADRPPRPQKKRVGSPSTRATKRASGPPPRLSQAANPTDEPAPDDAAFAARRPTAKKPPPPAIDTSDAATSQPTVPGRRQGPNKPATPKPGKPARPSSAKPTSPRPDKPATAKPAKPSSAKPTSPRPDKPATAKPAKPSSAKPTSPRPDKPTAAKPAKPAAAKPAKPAAAKPAKPAAAKPAKPAAAKPAKPAAAKPAKPAAAKPAKPAAAKPAKPAAAKPAKPASAKPAKPASAKPTKPASAKPTASTSSSTTAAAEPASESAAAADGMDCLDDINALMADFEFE